MAVIRRPPLLRIRHKNAQIFNHSVKIKRLELFGIVKFRAHGAGQGGLLMQYPQVQLVGPPILPGFNPRCRLFVRAAYNGAFGLRIHCLSPIRLPPKDKLTGKR